MVIKAEVVGYLNIPTNIICVDNSRSEICIPNTTMPLKGIESKDMYTGMKLKSYSNFRIEDEITFPIWY
jgi:hypothetical protein